MHNPFFHRCLNVSRLSLTLQTNTPNSTEFPASDPLETSSTQFYGVWALNVQDAFLATFVAVDHQEMICVGFPGTRKISSLGWHNLKPTWWPSTLTSVSYSDLLPYEQRTTVTLDANFPIGGVHYFPLRHLHQAPPKALQAMTLRVCLGQSEDAATALKFSPC